MITIRSITRSIDRIVALSLATCLGVLFSCGQNQIVPVRQDVVAAADAVADAVADVPVVLGEPEWRLLAVPSAGVQSWGGLSGVVLPSGQRLVAAVGSAGSVALYDGAEWHWRNIGVPRNLYAVWVGDMDNVVVMGDEGIIRRWNTQYKDWLIDDIGEVTGPLFAIHGDANDPRYACGENGVILRWAPQSDRWEFLVRPGAASTENRKLEAIWASGPNDIVAVGSRLIMRFDGVAWQPTAVPHELHAVWGVAGGPVYAAGDGPMLLTLDRATGEWQTETYEFAFPFNDLIGFGERSLLAATANSFLVKFDLPEWSIVLAESRLGTPDSDWIPPTVRFQHLWASQPEDIFVIGDVRRSDERVPIFLQYGRFPVVVP